VVYPLANLLATEQVCLGDIVRIDWDGLHKQLTFVREGEAAIVRAENSPLGEMAAAVPGKDGKGKDSPAELVEQTSRRRIAVPAALPMAVPQGRKKVDR
jgi:hypothetical protein